MLVLKLAYMGELDFIKELQEVKTLLKNKDIVIGFVEQIQGDVHIIKIMCEDDCCSEKVTEKIKLQVSNALYKMVINNYKEKELLQFLSDTYFFLKQDEILELENDIMDAFYRNNKINDETGIYCENKINAIVDKIKNCLEENNQLNINGFIRFRMRELREDIERVIDKIVEKFMVEKEYREFIKLLKYFVEIQDSKIEEVHLYVESGRSYRIEDDKGKNIFNEFMRDITDCKLGVDANVEDIIISGLITNAPKRIIIFNKELCTNKEFIDTIEKVFIDRVTYDTSKKNLI